MEIVLLNRFLLNYCAAAVVPGMFLLGASYAGNDVALVVVLFSLGMGLMGFWYPGARLNSNDLSPNYAATIMAISNGIGALAGAATPYVVGILVPNVSVRQKGFFFVFLKFHDDSIMFFAIQQKSLLEWRLVFWLTLGILVITTIAYALWASGEIQPWNDLIIQAKTIERNKIYYDSEDPESRKDIDDDKEQSQLTDKN